MFRNNSFILLESHHLNDKKMEQTGRLFRYHLSANTLRGSDSIAFVQSHPPNILPCSRVGETWLHLISNLVPRAFPSKNG